MMIAPAEGISVPNMRRITESNGIMRPLLRLTLDWPSIWIGCVKRSRRPSATCLTSRPPAKVTGKTSSSVVTAVTG